MPLPRGTAFANCFSYSSKTDRRVLPSHHPRRDTRLKPPHQSFSLNSSLTPSLLSVVPTGSLERESRESVLLVTNWPTGKGNTCFVVCPDTGLAHIFLWLLPVCIQHFLMIIYLPAFNGILGVINRSCFGWAPYGKSEGCISSFCSASMQFWHTHPNLREMDDGCVV